MFRVLGWLVASLCVASSVCFGAFGEIRDFTYKKGKDTLLSVIVWSQHRAGSVTPICSEEVTLEYFSSLTRMLN